MCTMSLFGPIDNSVDSMGMLSLPCGSKPSKVSLQRHLEGAQGPTRSSRTHRLFGGVASALPMEAHGNMVARALDGLMRTELCFSLSHWPGAQIQPQRACFLLCELAIMTALDSEAIARTDSNGQQKTFCMAARLH